MTSPCRCVVIAMGNPFRRDDGVGHAVLEALRARGGPGPGVALVHLDGEPARLLDAWAGVELAVVVDAVRGAGAPGSVHPRGVHLGGAPAFPATPRAAVSSHGEGLPAALALGAALGRLPGRLVVVGVEAADLGEGPGLSPPVAAGVEVAARLVATLAAS